MVEKESTIDHYSSNTTRVKVWKGKKFRLAHFLVALVLLAGGLLVASYAYNQYSQSMTTNQLIGYNMLYQSGIQTLGKGLPSIPENEIVPIAQSGWHNDTDTVAGTIDFDGMALPEVFPLCIDNEWLGDYWIALTVTGGYEPHDGFIKVYQKDEKVGKIWIQWELMNPEATCCEEKIWNATFCVCEPICLDSNQYPDVGEDWNLWAQYPEIPGKDVDLKIVTFWQGCCLPDQAFVIISVQ